MSTITLKTAYRRTSVSKLKIRAAVKAAYSEKNIHESAVKEQEIVILKRDVIPLKYSPKK